MSMSVISSANYGMRAATSRLESSASKIARIGDGSGDVDVAGEMINVLQAKFEFEANAKMARAGGDMLKSAIDILA
ncbi:flagellar basal body rod C-terminal domain-containing protein [Devosia sp.]|uniref:flagellar basal body rod C-terminal domain-containing protein n=1 Tax=Devosia sp. TaxID=1871048 RepID=UPI003265CACF